MRFEEKSDFFLSGWGGILENMLYICGGNLIVIQYEQDHILYRSRSQLW